MNSHTDSASVLEAPFPASSPETANVAVTSSAMTAFACDSANGVHMPGCTCVQTRVRLQRR
jgi:hypothetical protein